MEDFPFFRLIFFSFSDLSYGEFLNILSYYCKKTGKSLTKINRWYPSSKTCSNCGWYNKKLTLKNRIFKCKICGTNIDRDLNASINIKRVGTSTLCESKDSIESYNL